MLQFVILVSKHWDTSSVSILFSNGERFGYFFRTAISDDDVFHGLVSTVGVVAFNFANDILKRDRR